MNNRLVDIDIIKDRVSKYGNNFPTMKKLWNSYLKKRFGESSIQLDEQDCAMLMSLLKISRLINDLQGQDTLTDLMNYLWIGFNFEDYNKIVDNVEKGCE